MIRFGRHRNMGHDSDDPDARKHPSVWDRSADKVLDYWQATEAERAAVDVAARAMLSFEQRATVRRINGVHTEPTAGDVLDKLGVDTARWAALATATIYRAEQLRGRPCVLDYQRRRRATAMARYRAAHPEKCGRKRYRAA